MKATEIFELWNGDARKGFAWEQFEVECPAYLAFRRAGRHLQRLLLDAVDERANKLLEVTRSALGEMTTTPMEFDAMLAERITTIGGGVARVRADWGAICGDLFQSFVDSAQVLCRSGSALRQVVREKIREFANDGLRIYCHRKSLQYFIDAGADETQAIMTPVAYSDTRRFGVLLKVGGMRRIGYGRVPEAVVAAPRFERLIQVVWSPDVDDADFGESFMEPLGFSARTHWELKTNTTICHHLGCRNIQIDRNEQENMDPLDERIRERIREVTGTTLKGTVIHLAGGRVLMQRPGSALVVYSPRAARVEEKEAEDLVDGDLLLRFGHPSIDLGSVVTNDSDLVKQWREDLKVAYHRNPASFLVRLRNGGVNLVHLESAVYAWFSGRRRPQDSDHFDAVSSAIGWDTKKAKAAWRDLQKQHGMAVQHGLLVAELAVEALVQALNSAVYLEALRDCAASASGASLCLNVDIAGTAVDVSVFGVEEVEPTEDVPENRLDEIMSAQEWSP